MAKKRGGGAGSNMGLIITLIFFVLATLILGVTTYFGFADQEAKEKAKADAVAKEKKREEERNWYRFQVRVLRQYISRPPAGLDAADLAREKALFDKGQLTYANGQTDKDDFAKLVKELDTTMKWNAAVAQAPTSTFDTRLDEKDKALDLLRKANTQISAQRDDLQSQATELKKQLDDEKKIFNDAIIKANENIKDDLKKVRDQIDALQKDLALKGKEKADETLARADTQRKLDALEKVRRTLEGKLAKATTDMKEVRESLDETKDKLAKIVETSHVDLDKLEAQRLDNAAREILKGWKRDWRIVQIDKRGKMPYINLGSADGLTPQVTFSIHTRGLDGKLDPTPKGTLEVVRVAGLHHAQTRITSLRDERKDPILVGDQLFNPTWDPNLKRHIALAGIADLGGEGTDNTEDFRRLLARQGVILDAYIDTKDDKTPKIIGKGISTNTDYLVLADTLEAVQHPKSRDKPYAQGFDRLVTELKGKANATGVPVITLRKYLDMIGYRAPKVVTSNPTVGGYSR